MNQSNSVSLRTQCNTALAFGFLEPLNSLSVRDTHENISSVDIVTLTKSRIQELIIQENIFRGEAFEKILVITLLKLLTDETNEKCEALKTYEANGEIWALTEEAKTKIDTILQTTQYHQWCSDDDL